MSLIKKRVSLTRTVAVEPATGSESTVIFFFEFICQNEILVRTSREHLWEDRNHVNSIIITAIGREQFFFDE